MLIDKISVFFPAYNEAENIESTVFKALEFLPKIAASFEVIVVDDGSSDQTAKIVEKIVASNKNVRLIKHSRNLGYGAALKTGLYSSRFPLIAFTDADGQFNINQLVKFLPKIKYCDLVVGYRIKRADKFIRILNAKAWGFLIRVLFGLRVKDIDCGFKLIKKDVIEKISRLESDGALVSAELLVQAKKAGFKICEVGIDHFPRKKGQQTGANVRVIAKAFIELFKLYTKLK
ncbi:MAG: glycosyltransferase family 2 protein [Candidatus Aenigmatarchaeota archaeon]